MDELSRPAKSTGYTPSTGTESGNASPPVEFTGRSKASPVLSNAPTKDESLISTGEVSASNILALQIMLGDFKTIKAEMSGSWQASKDGKIYWCASMPGHILAIENGKLLVDGESASSLLEKLLDA